MIAAFGDHRIGLSSDPRHVHIAGSSRESGEAFVSRRRWSHSRQPCYMRQSTLRLLYSMCNPDGICSLEMAVLIAAIAFPPLDGSTPSENTWFVEDSALLGFSVATFALVTFYHKSIAKIFGRKMFQNFRF